MTFLFLRLISLYQRLVSPMIKARCRFIPSCSSYALIALSRFGMRGMTLVIKRLLRCQPIHIKKFGENFGCDPVPEFIDKKTTDRK